MSGQNKDDNNWWKPPKNVTKFYLIIIAIVLAINIFVVPVVQEYQVQELPYSTFIEQVESDQVSEVEINQYDLSWRLDDDKQVYQTGRIDDPNLVQRLSDKNITFKADIYEPRSPLVSFLLTFVLPILFFSWLSRRMMKRMMGGDKSGFPGGSGGIMNFGKSNAKKYVKSDNSKTFTDVAGQEEAKDSLVEVVDFLKRPAKYQKIGAKAPKGILLVGPPGTGKTLLAQAVAGEADVPFFSIAGSEFVEMFVGRGAAKVRDLFKQANDQAPCIVFIDEIDTIGKKRDGNMSGNDEREQTLNQLLTEMDGFEGNEGVILLAATNRPESLDKALLRPGRFDRQVRVELPDLKGRIAILKVHAKNYQVDHTIDYAYIARATAGASGADLANIVNEGALRAVRMGRDKVSQTDLEEAVEVVIAGEQRKNEILSPQEKRVVAYHEIGHALVAAKQSQSAPVEKITIIPRTSGALGYTMQVESDQKSLYSKQELYNKIVTLAGGRAAEEIVFNEITTGASNDIEKMTKMARSLVTQYGMTSEFDMMQIESNVNPYLSEDTQSQVSGGMAHDVDKKVLAIIKQAHNEAGEILLANREKLNVLSEYLLKEETITGQEFMKLLNQ
ncbi:ATP-dependent zinc metalloprotease FtsH [Aerococcus kribbianus]|uniref:ATP-dependent zinc metalloprotease FtsH n=1 Tax=Aerococcus kribbianus TaxID=2999064 RepID=A0A9X3JE23_9LACT|nr:MULTISPECIES: ATP-dependent zinc metalloprotease FtsH [unclassified Aerococcus]MCZ0718028.1 ATP-dependent zinc metalloprotease FtsH [Aerococcus sp. YH-aer221]MCZ0726403.1 ATP-dependent zinc metalloprotease FtsH [Aerococcus sp. YH-aer222]